MINKKDEKNFRNPVSIFILLLATILISEIIVMYLLPLIIPKDTSEFLLNMADGVLLTVIVSPIIWWLIIQPLRSEMYVTAKYSKFIIDETVLGVVLLSQNGVITICNNAFLKIIEKSLLEIKNKKITELLNLPDDFFNDEKDHTYTLVVNGKSKDLHLKYNQFNIQNKIFWTIFIEDISDKLIYEKKLEAQRAMVVSSSKLAALGEMAGGIAHEINTPLSLIQLRTDQLQNLLIGKKEFDQEKVEKALASIDSTNKRIANIVRGLRNFARDGSKDPLTAYSLKKIIDDTFGLCREKFYLNSVKMEVNIPDELEVHCRPTEISQVLLNLFNNSFDAIQNDLDKWIKVDVKLTNERVLIEVADSGHGISQEVLDKIMMPFFTTKELGKGTGLGLSISKGIVESHHGNLHYKAGGKNTTFVIELPRNI